MSWVELKLKLEFELKKPQLSSNTDDLPSVRSDSSDSFDGEFDHEDGDDDDEYFESNRNDEDLNCY